MKNQPDRAKLKVELKTYTFNVIKESITPKIVSIVNTSCFLDCVFVPFVTVVPLFETLYQNHASSVLLQVNLFFKICADLSYRVEMSDIFSSSNDF